MSKREVTRRGFLRTAAAASALAAAGSAQGADPPATTTPSSINPTTSSAEAQMEPKSYEAEIPDTLDLVARARLAINAMTVDVDPKKDYSPYGSGVGNFFLTAKYLEALPMMRQMSGSEQNLDVEAAMMETMVRNIGDDGLVYCPNNSPERRGGRGYKETDEDYNSPYASARLILAMMAWHQRDGDAKWLELIKRQADGLRHIAIKKDDYAYYPDPGVAFDFAYLRKSGYVKTDEPDSERGGAEGTVKFYQANQVRALTRLYELTGDPQWLEFAGKIVRFMMKPQFWADDALAETVGTERAHWRGHSHGHLTTFRALLRYAVAADDQKLKEFVRAGYEYARNFGIHRIGFVQGWIGPNPVGHHNACESCAISGMMALAIKLSDVGLGDYWDDLDTYVRNHLLESQYVDPKLISAVLEKVRPTHRGAYDQSPLWYQQSWLGGFEGASDVTSLTVGPPACCTGNGSTALFYAWEAALRHHDGVVEINLLLNRASPWLDMDSYLPYEGRVVLRNKSARTVSVRLPNWVTPRAVRCQLNGRAVEPLQVVNRLLFTSLSGNECITIEFPVATVKTTFTLASIEYARGRGEIPRTQFTGTFRANTLLHVSPLAYNPFVPHPLYPIYQRDHFKAAKAPLVKTKRYVAPFSITW